MASRQLFLKDVGPVTIVKRRCNNSLRLSVKADRQVQLSMPYWTPYLIGESFIRNRKDWILSQLDKIPENRLAHGDRIGKNHRLYFLPSTSKRVNVSVSSTEIRLKSSYPINHELLQSKALAACEKALKMQCEELLLRRAKDLSGIYGLHYNKIRFRKLASRWGSCSSQKNITFSIYLIQLPWQLIDYVILHELVHLEHMNHSQDFWRLLTKLMPQAKKLRREIKTHNPSIQPVKTLAMA